MLRLSNIKRLMVIVAHPDDEILGLGGTLHKIKSETKCEIKVVILGEGITSRTSNFKINNNKNKLKTHQNNIIKAKKIIGYDYLKTYQLPDNQFDTIPLLSIIKIIEEEKKEFNPELVLTHHLGDVNIDHQLTFNAVNTAFRPQPGEEFKGVMTFETPSGTEWISQNDPRKFNPNFFVELKKTDIDKKIEAMESYEFEKRVFPHPRSPEALLNRSIYWGVGVGLNYVEPFQLIRYLSKNE
jgi:LmbE family N-acetylglucosaminyl deacetylase